MDLFDIFLNVIQSEETASYFREKLAAALNANYVKFRQTDTSEFIEVHYVIENIGNGNYLDIPVEEIIKVGNILFTKIENSELIFGIELKTNQHIEI